MWVIYVWLLNRWLQPLAGESLKLLTNFIHREKRTIHKLKMWLVLTPLIFWRKDRSILVSPCYEVHKPGQSD